MLKRNGFSQRLLSIISFTVLTNILVPIAAYADGNPSMSAPQHSLRFGIDELNDEEYQSRLAARRQERPATSGVEDVAVRPSSFQYPRTQNTTPPRASTTMPVAQHVQTRMPMHGLHNPSAGARRIQRVMPPDLGANSNFNWSPASDWDEDEVDDLDDADLGTSDCSAIAIASASASTYSVQSKSFRGRTRVVTSSTTVISISGTSSRSSISITSRSSSHSSGGCFAEAGGHGSPSNKQQHCVQRNLGEVCLLITEQHNSFICGYTAAVMTYRCLTITLAKRRC
jgi:hypothetical protein